jgi:tRNA A-37 threonylcarbamoyl transferase component Bud32
MNLRFEPILSLIGLSAVELVLVLAAMLIFFAILAGGAVLVIFLTRRRSEPKAPPPPSKPWRGAGAARPVSAVCPQCGAKPPAGAPEGLCPACLLKRAMPSEPGAADQPRLFVPPEVAELAGKFPQLEILQLIGRGGMGAVYKARQPALDRFVALKILAPRIADSPGFAERFNREARALARLVHPNIVAVHDFGKAGDLNYLIMEYVDGSNLRQVEQAGRLAPEQALAIVPQICEALQFAHNEGVVHRDIKPENILLDTKGRVKITDFGIAKILGDISDQAPLTGVKDTVGTPHYMAPEQIESPALVDHRADIFSLGVVFYEMLTGELPLGKFAPPSQRVHVDVRLDEVVLRTLEKEPARRYQQASEVKTQVETIATAPPGGLPVAPAPAMITAPAVALMVAALLKVSSAFTALFVLSTGSVWLDRLFGFGHFLGGLESLAVVGVLLFKAVPALLIAYGAIQMLQRRSYAWAMAAAIISIVSCSLLGFPVGIWALIVLTRADARQAFGSNEPAAPMAPQTGRFWRRFALVAGCVILLLFATAVILAVAFGIAPALDRARTRAGEVNAGVYLGTDGEFHKDSTQSFPLNDNGSFSLDEINGRIEIHGWSSNAVLLHTAIHGKTGESVDAVKINIDSKPGKAKVHTEQPSSATGFPWSWLWFKDDPRNDASVDYTVQVPWSARLEDISSVSGRIAIDGVSGDIAASTVSGETRINGAAGNLKLSTVNGRIAAGLASLGPGQSVSLNSVNGTMELTLPDNADASLSADTLNGKITSEFPSLQPDNQLAVGHDLRGKLGNGGATVRASAVDGAIKILNSRTPRQTPPSAPATPPVQTLTEQQ